MRSGSGATAAGRRASYSSDETGRNEVFVRAFPDVESFKVQVSTQGGYKPMWAHSGSELFFVSGNDEMMAAMVETEDEFRVVGQETLFTIPAVYVVDSNVDFYDVAPNDQGFLMGRRVQSESGASETPELILVQNFFTELRERLGEN